MRAKPFVFVLLSPRRPRGTPERGRGTRSENEDEDEDEDEEEAYEAARSRNRVWPIGDEYDARGKALPGSRLLVTDSLQPALSGRSRCPSIRPDSSVPPCRSTLGSGGTCFL